jgi:molecular chaperone GrpE
MNINESTPDMENEVEAPEKETASVDNQENETAENSPNEEIDPLEKIQNELNDMKDKYIRLYAEFDNYRKRTLREREDLIKTASQETIKSLLPTLDDFERAMKAMTDTNENPSIIDGISLIHDKLLKTLEQKGLKSMQSNQVEFNPDLHEAITKVPAGEENKGIVIETIEKGYYLNDKIIRYAKVVVGQ